MQADRIRKSVGAETTFERDILQWDEAVQALAPVFAKVWAAYSRGGHAGRTVTIKVKFADFQQVTRSRSGADPVATQTRLERVSLDLLRPFFPSARGIRLLGVTMSSLDTGPQPAPAQLALGFG